MKLTQIDRKNIVAQLETKQATETELAERYKVTIASIGYVYKKLTGHAFKPQLTQREREAIVAALQAGNVTTEELAKQYHVTSWTISRVYKTETGKSFRTPWISEKVKDEIVKEIRTNATITKQELARKHGIHTGTLERIIKQKTGETFSSLRAHLTQQLYEEHIKLARALRQRTYRAWHKQERTMYEVLGINWYTQEVLIARQHAIDWVPMEHVTLMRYSGLRDRKRTPAYPKGQEICAGDIVQLPINLRRNDGVTRKTLVKDVVTFDRESGWFVLPQLDDDPLCIYHEESEVIGNIYEHPDRRSEAPSFLQG